MITDIYELQDIVVRLMGDPATELNETERMEDVLNQSLRELNWDLPVDDSFQEYWIIERSKRHALYALIFEAAKKFRFKQIFLQQRFENYFKLLEKMDKDFLDAIEANPDLFDVPSGSTLAFYITNGFSYDFMGNDISFNDDYWI